MATPAPAAGSAPPVPVPASLAPILNAAAAQNMTLQQAVQAAINAKLKLPTAPIPATASVPSSTGSVSTTSTTANSAEAAAYSMACRLYVGSLYYDITEADVRSLFEAFGEISKCDMSYDSNTRKSKGYCFVEFTKPEYAAAALAMNGFEIAGRKIKVGRPNGGPNGTPNPLTTLQGPTASVGTIGGMSVVLPGAPVANAPLAAAPTNPYTAPLAAAQSLAAQATAPAAITAVAPVPPPTATTLTLSNMVSAAEAREDATLAEEIEEEARTFGELKDPIHIHILDQELRQGAGEQLTVAQEDDAVRVVLVYKEAKDALRAFKAMNGRFFGGKTVRAVLS